MPNYQNGLIYKLCCLNTDITDIYIGSTTNFKQRKKLHKSVCNNENSKDYNCDVYKFIRENGGFQNWDMILVEYYSCKTKLELMKREREIIEELKSTLNKIIPTRTKKEYYENNKEQLLEKKKEYNEKNKEQIAEYQKKYNEDNKEKIKETYKKWKQNNKEKVNKINKEWKLANPEKVKANKKKYRENNKKKIKEYKSQQIICECGVKSTKSSIARHRRSKFHQEYENLWN